MFYSNNEKIEIVFEPSMFSAILTKLKVSIDETLNIICFKYNFNMIFVGVWNYDVEKNGYFLQRLLFAL